MTEPKRVLVVEDSPVVRELLIHLIENDPRLCLAAAVGSAEECLKLLAELRPDVISMDIHLPGMDGLAATRAIMADQPTPIVVVSSSIRPGEVQLSMEALRAGAVAVAEKPSGPGAADHAVLAQRMCTQLAIMSEVQVVRQRRPAGFESRVRSALPAQRPPPIGSESRLLPIPGSARLRPRILGIATSTGGPAALATLFAGLGADFPLSVVVVQHITPGFMPGFVAWLDGGSPLRVSLAADLDLPRPGCIHLAPDGFHLTVADGRLRLVVDDGAGFHCPSGSVLLASLAREYGGQAIGVVLTGMGNDGAKGLLAMRQAGASTLAEDRSSAIVYGMPEAAVTLGAVEESLPLAAIAPRLRQLAGLSSSPPPSAKDQP